MATLTVTTTTDYRSDNTLNNITDILFDTTATGVSALFNASQLDGNPISTSVHIAGDGVEEFITVVVDTASFSAAGWTFDNWNSLSLVILESGGGANDIIGSSSDDLIVYGQPSDIAFGESVDGGGGFDTIQTSFGTYDFSVAPVSHVEAIAAQSPQFTSFLLTGAQIGAGAITSVAGFASTHLTVTGAAVDLAGVAFTGWSADILINGSFGADKLAGSNLRDVLDGGFGTDTILARGGNDRLVGGPGDDVLSGGIGRDALVGGPGKDTLFGGLDSDRFDFDAIGDSVPGANRDLINGFSRTEHDQIDLSTIDADQRSANPGNDVFVFIGGQSFAAYHAAHPGTFGMVRFSNNLLQATVDANLAADFSIALSGLANLAAADLVL